MRWDWVFFFSSRRRHTRCSRDWSSDVCSSDLLEEIQTSVGFNSHNLLTGTVWLRDLQYLQPQRQRQFFENVLQRLANLPRVQSAAGATDLPYNFPGYVPFTVEEIGRASCRERV